MRVAVVGSRKFSNRSAVEAVIHALPAGTLVVSGGARGVDSWAVEAAKACGLETLELLPDLAGVRHRGDVARRMHERNGRVVAASDRVVAFVAEDRKGGTENTLLRARAANKPREIHWPDGRIDRE